MSPVERVLARLEAVRETVPGRWMARCPAHEDRTPSLSVREGDDGRVLVYCFGGCGGMDVVAALGLDMSDLFPEPLRTPTTSATPTRRRRPAPPIPAADAVRILDVESMVVEIIADRLAQGEPVTDHRVALTAAATRIAGVRAAWRLAP